MQFSTRVLPSAEEQETLDARSSQNVVTSDVRNKESYTIVITPLFGVALNFYKILSYMIVEKIIGP